MVGGKLKNNFYIPPVNPKRRKALVETNFLSNKINAYTKNEVGNFANLFYYILWYALWLKKLYFSLEK